MFLLRVRPGLFFGYKTQGIIQEEDVVDGKVGYISSDGSTKYYTSSVGNDMAAGNIKCVDVNEDGIVDPNDMVVIGDPNPDFTYGFRHVWNGRIYLFLLLLQVFMVMIF